MSVDSPNVGERKVHTFQAQTDIGTVLKPEETAIIVDPDGQMFMLTRHREGDVEDVSRLELFLAAVFLKCDDEEWMDEMIEEYFGEDSDCAGHC